MIIKHSDKEARIRVFISAHILKSIYVISKKHLPNEFGGIFTGFNNENDFVIVDFELPSEFKQTKVSFTREGDSLNSYLSEIHSQSEGSIVYLGEWHTHPYGTARYSNNDYKSMVEIARATEVKIPNPILIVFSIDDDSFDYQIYCIIKDKLIILDKIEKI